MSSFLNLRMDGGAERCGLRPRKGPPTLL